jgi:hypothetical protein
VGKEAPLNPAQKQNTQQHSRTDSCTETFATWFHISQNPEYHESLTGGHFTTAAG